MLFNHLRSLDGKRANKTRRFVAEPLERRTLLSSGSIDLTALSPLSRGRRSTVYVDTIWAGSSQGASVSDPNAWFGGGRFSFGVNAFATVQDGVNHVPFGGIVDVAAGTYSENVILSQPLTLNGAQMGVSGTDPSRGGSGETSISAGSGIGLTISTTGVIIDGIQVTGDIGVNSGAALTIRDDVVSTTDVAISIGGSAAGNVIVQDDSVTSSGGGAISYQPSSAAIFPGKAASFTVVDSSVSGGPGTDAGGTGITIGNGTTDIRLSTLTLARDAVTTSGGPDVFVFGANVSVDSLAVNNNVLAVTNGYGGNIDVQAAADLVIGDRSSIRGNFDTGANGDAAILLSSVGGSVAIGGGSAIDGNAITAGFDASGAPEPAGGDGIDITAPTITLGRAGAASVSISGNNISSSLGGIGLGARELILNSALNIGTNGNGNVISALGRGALFSGGTGGAVGKPINVIGNRIVFGLSSGLSLGGNWSAPVNITGNTISGGAGVDGIAMAPFSGGWSGPITISGNNINAGTGVSLDGTDGPVGFTGPITIASNNITGASNIGIDLSGIVSNASILGNDIRNHAAQGILIEAGIYGGSGISIQNNFIENNGIGVLIQSGASGPISINDNSIGQDVSYGYPGNTVAGLDNESAVLVDARFNWWGDASGPGGIGPGSGDKVLGSNVNFTPWLTNGVDADAPNRGDGFQPSRRRRGPTDHRWRDLTDRNLQAPRVL